jgi:EAL domain-containing protein (putative c-di-GMP-specific phosphodiesterase class I)
MSKDIPVPPSKSPPASADPVRLERDRYVAFAFAAADLLIEATAENVISAASGAAQSVVGRPVRELVGLRFEELVAVPDQAFIRQLLKQIHDIGRIAPARVCLIKPEGKPARILLGGCRLANMPDRIFLSATLLPSALASMPAQPRDDSTGLLSKDAFQAAAERSAGAEGAGSPQLKFLQLEGLAGAARQLVPDSAAMLMEEIGAALRAQSIDGDAAGRLGDEAFGIVTTGGDDRNRDATLLKQLGDVIRHAGIKDGQIAPHMARIDLAGAGLTDGDIGRSIAYAINAFVNAPSGGLGFTSLAGGLAEAVGDTMTRVVSTRRMIADAAFSLVFQPVVRLDTKAIHHYEALSRFPGNKSPFETIVFSEDMGLIPELDLAVCRRAVEALGQHPDASIAINLSGRSIQNDGFRQSFSELVRPLNPLRGRLLFELTESAVVEDLEDAAAFLRWLRKLGHSICLDDFGAGAAAYSYLRRFDVDFVKIDGPFLKSATDHARERALIRSICVLCREIGCGIIGEMIEDEKLASLAATLGIDYGQGWLFGKPVAEIPKPPPAGRRKGSVESWA